MATTTAARPPTSSGRRTTAPPGTTRIAGLDGLRALAVVAVLVFHLRAPTLPGGFLGVDVFFVVSGFLITTLLLREIAATGRLDLAGFWTRRARRLLPALAVVVVVAVSAARVVGGDLLVDIDRQVLGALTFSTNWWEIHAGTSYFTHTAPQLFVTFWSLAVEEQFYLVWPVLLAFLLALARRRSHLVLGVLALGAASAVAMAVLVTPGQDATAVYYATHTHAFGLMIGAALALATAGAPTRWGTGSMTWQRWSPVAGAVGLVTLVVLAATLRDGATFTYRGGLLLASLATALVIAALLGPRGRLVAAFEARPVRWVGQRSYGIYLWHWPVLLVVGAVLPAASADSPTEWTGRALALLLTLGAAAASYRWIEEPVRRLGFRVCAARVRAALGRPWAAVHGPRLAGGLVVALVITTGFAVATAPDKSATELAIEAGEAQLAASGRHNAGALGDRTGMPTGEEITAFGDSIMVTSLGGLNTRFPGIDVQAKSIRQWPDGATVVTEALAEGTVRRAVVLGFGTNAGVQDPELVRGVLRELGPRRMVVLVNVFQHSHWVPETNEALAQVANEFDNVILADWHKAIAPRTDLLQADRIHPGVEGGHFYAEVVANAFEQLAARLQDGVAPAADGVGG